MARHPRFVIPGQPQHVIQRGNNREVIFAADQDYRFYLEKLKEACDRHQCDVHAYVLMSNHVHLLMTPHQEEGIGKVLQALGRSYVQYFNYSYGRTGTLWEGRYKATLIDSDNYLLSCCRYIELNPVRQAHDVNRQPDVHALFLPDGDRVFCSIWQTNRLKPIPQWPRKDVNSLPNHLHELGPPEMIPNGIT